MLPWQVLELEQEQRPHQDLPFARTESDSLGYITDHAQTLPLRRWAAIARRYWAKTETGRRASQTATCFAGPKSGENAKGQKGCCM